MCDPFLAIFAFAWRSGAESECLQGLPALTSHGGGRLVFLPWHTLFILAFTLSSQVKPGE